jgi:hypothetical protein
MAGRAYCTVSGVGERSGIMPLLPRKMGLSMKFEFIFENFFKAFNKSDATVVLYLGEHKKPLLRTESTYPGVTSC